MKPVSNHHFLAFLLTFALGSFLSAPVVAKEELPEVDSDGLHLLKSTRTRIVYGRPGASLEGYDKVMLLECFVQFRENWARDYNLNQLGLQGRISNKDEERIKDSLSEEFGKVFTEVLTSDGHEVVTETGEGVLLLRPAIVNLSVSAPDMMRAGRGNTWVTSAGEMTLYMELYDAASNELLARVVDARADRDNVTQVANRATNKAAADRIIRSWATELSKHLTDVKTGGE